jgi:magnesium transporter
MIRSFAFTTQGRLHTKDIDLFLMPTLLADTNLFLWVDLEASTAEEAKTILGGIFHFHPLSIEDCINATPNPKVEQYTPKDEDQFSPYLFMVIHAVDYSRKDGVFATSELNFFLGKNFLVTYHDVPLKSVSATAERATRGTMHIARAPDRVAHTLLDTLVDNYKPAMEELSIEIAELENDVVEHPNQRTLNKIIGIKREVLHLRQIIGPQQEVLKRFADGEFKLIRAHLVPYYRDIYDRLFHISNLAQGYTDSLTGILHIHLSMTSNKTGETVKALTLITIVTTPAMMIGTWYGMNFESMPEVKWLHGYSFVFGLTAVTTLATWWYVKKRKWF